MGDDHCPSHQPEADEDGGLSPGAPRGPRNGRYVSGCYSQQATEDRQKLRILIKQMRRTLGEL